MLRRKHVKPDTNLEPLFLFSFATLLLGSIFVVLMLFSFICFRCLPPGEFWFFTDGMALSLFQAFAVTFLLLSSWIVSHFVMRILGKRPNRFHWTSYLAVFALLAAIFFVLYQLKAFSETYQYHEDRALAGQTIDTVGNPNECWLGKNVEGRWRILATEIKGEQTDTEGWLVLYRDRTVRAWLGETGPRETGRWSWRDGISIVMDSESELLGCYCQSAPPDGQQRQISLQTRDCRSIALGKVTLEKDPR